MLRNQLNQAQRQLEHAAPRESTKSVDSPLRENLARHQGELKAAKNAQRRVEGEITRMRMVQKEAEEELEDLKLRIMERDGTILGALTLNPVTTMRNWYLTCAQKPLTTHSHHEPLQRIIFSQRCR